jgi:hypothetical protein
MQERVVVPTLLLRCGNEWSQHSPLLAAKMARRIPALNIRWLILTSAREAEGHQ